MKRFLVAYDGSPEAKKALEHTIGFTDPDDEIIVLSVISDPDPFFFSSNEPTITQDEIEEQIEVLKYGIDKPAPKFVIKIVQGEIIKEIIKAGEEFQCNLIVLGYKGITNIGKFRLGSVSGEVAKHAKRPVLIVK